MLRRLSLSMALLVLAACSDAPDGPITAPGPDFGRERAGPGDLSALTWNVYYGADLDVLLAEDGPPLPVRVAQAFGQVQATDAPARAASMAEKIAAAPADLIGLQEVVRWRTQSPGDFLDEEGSVQNPVPNATDEVFDFADLLVEALAARGLTYVEAARTETFDVEAPMVTPEAQVPPFVDLRLTEAVVVLARAGLATSDPRGGVFGVNLPITLAGFEVEVVKGWASVDATVKGRTYRFVTTHLEPADVLPGQGIHPDIHQIQLAQASEVLAAVEDHDGPVILTGDLNSEPGGTSTDTYGLMQAAGFVDTWLVGRPRGDGFTANQAADLQNGTSELWHRIDFVLYRDDVTADGGPFRGSVHAERLGEAQDDRTASGLWPSDHAGVRATLRTEQPPPR